MQAPKLIVVPVLLAVVVPAACGDDGDPGPRLSAGEFAERANAICVAGDEELDEAGQDLFSGEQPQTAEIADFFLDEAIPIARRKLDQIEDLNPPEAEEETIEEMLAAGRSAIDQVEEGLEDDPGGYMARGGPDPFEPFNQMAQELGLARCASAVEPLPGEDGTTSSTAPTTETPP